MSKQEKKQRKPLGFIHFYHAVFSEGMSLKEVAEFTFEKDYANNSL
jgi:hypothetical protein